MKQRSTVIPILGMFLKKTCTTYIRVTVVREVFIADKRQDSCGDGGIKAALMTKRHECYMGRTTL